jgi:MFS transporter, DHA2 family, multidrug resistance protein
MISAYIDDYKLLMIATLSVMPLLMIFKKPPRSEAAAAADAAHAME